MYTCPATFLNKTAELAAALRYSPPDPKEDGPGDKELLELFRELFLREDSLAYLTDLGVTWAFYVHRIHANGKDALTAKPKWNIHPDQWCLEKLWRGMAACIESNSSDAASALARLCALYSVISGKQDCFGAQVRGRGRLGDDDWMTLQAKLPRQIWDYVHASEPDPGKTTLMRPWLVHLGPCDDFEQVKGTLRKGLGVKQFPEWVLASVDTGCQAFNGWLARICSEVDFARLVDAAMTWPEETSGLVRVQHVDVAQLPSDIRGTLVIRHALASQLYVPMLEIYTRLGGTFEGAKTSAMLYIPGTSQLLADGDVGMMVGLTAQGVSNAWAIHAAWEMLSSGYTKGRLEELNERATKASRKSAVAAIISRNMSHNIGSHVLAGLNAKTINDHPDAVARLMTYVQERMDFTARCVRDFPPWNEPMFFYAGLVRGFLDQGLLLGRLVADDGYPWEAKNGPTHIKFHVQVGNSEEVCFVWQRQNDKGQAQENGTNCRFVPKENGKEEDLLAKDVLISVPGGAVGKQAFFGLIENLIRNAAKHGSGKNTGTLEIHIQVCEEIEGCEKPEVWKDRLVQVRVWDNVSSAEKGKIRKYLKEPVVKPTGEPQAAGWGIQEMKIYADTLLAPYRTGQKAEFVVDPEAHEGPQGRGPGLRLWVEEESRAEGTKGIVHKFALMRARLIKAYEIEGTGAPEHVNWPAGGQRHGIEKHPGALCWQDAGQAINEDLGTAPPQMLVFQAHASRDVKALFEFVAHNHNRLPACLLLLVPADAEEAATCLDEPEASVEAKTAGKCYPGYLGGEWAIDDNEYFVPRRRLFVARTKLPCREAKDKTDSDFFHRATVELQATYLRAFWQEEAGKPNPTIGVEVYPGANQLATLDRLRKIACALQQRLSALRITAHQTAESAGLAETDVHCLFDSHQKMFNAVAGGAYRYQTLGGEQGMVGGLKNQIAAGIINHVPAGGGGELAVMQLLLACSQRVLIVDERLASCLTASRCDEGRPRVAVILPKQRDRLRSLWMSGCGAILSTWHAGRKGGHHRRFLVNPALTKSDIEYERDGEHEGIEIDGTSSEVRSICVLVPKTEAQDKGLRVESYTQWDVIIVHMGWIEKEEQLGGIRDRKAFLKSLLRFTGRLVVTSGRGKLPETPKLGDPHGVLPFIEYAAIGPYVVSELSKPSLGMGLLSIAGEEGCHGSGDDPSAGYQ